LNTFDEVRNFVVRSRGSTGLLLRFFAFGMQLAGQNADSAAYDCKQNELSLLLEWP
jgi:hypothetical protein